MTDTIREKVARLDALRRELRAAQGRAEGDDYRLYPPAAPGEIRAHERRTGRAFPPSFRAFLELANAWRGVMNGWTLIGLRRRETELYFREGLDEKVLGALRDLVPEAELRTLTTREKTDPKVLSPRDHCVVGVDGRGSALVLDGHRGDGGEPELALVKYVWVQKRWPNFGAMLDDAINEASGDLARLRAIPAAPKKKNTKAARVAATESPGGSKRRVVEIRRPAKTKPAAKKATPKKKEKVPAKSAPPSKNKKPAAKKRRA